MDTEPEYLDIGGFREWLPLELELDSDQYVESVVEHFADDPTDPSVLRAMATGLVAVAEQLSAMNDDQTLILGGWVLLPPGGERLVPRTVARLMAVRVPEGITPDELVADLIQDAPLHQPIHLETIQTASGPAQLVRARTYETAEHGVDLQETICVLWLPPGENYAVVLATLPIDDLVVAAEAASALTGLAESVKGLPQ
jgi:hypothetical protein